ncbi:unnamed protein product [Coregonus sp. 'balchen']|nr:unnamed protein product [Coregonus sp. 'balchen']
MRRLSITSLFVCFWLVERGQCDASLQDTMGELHTEFAVSLYKALKETENNSNLIVSPVSVSLSLGLLQLGARYWVVRLLGGQVAGWSGYWVVRLLGGQVTGWSGYWVVRLLGGQVAGWSGYWVVRLLGGQATGWSDCWVVRLLGGQATGWSGYWVVRLLGGQVTGWSDYWVVRLLGDMQVQDFLLRSQGDVGNSSHGVRLQQACALFIQTGVQILPAFTQHAASLSNSSLVRANFSQPNHTHSQLEQWGRNHGTGEPLQSGGSGERFGSGEALQPGGSGERFGSGEAQGETSWWGKRLQMALVNTVNFRGVWQKQFLFTDTQNLPFTLSDGSTIKVPMMYQATEVNFDQRYTVLELPYLGRFLSLLVALPSDRKTPLSSLESQITPRAVATWDTGLRRTKMDVFLPRFKMQNRFNLRSVLPSMGVTEEGLYVSDAFHEARIEVTEDGTKAAAATAMVLLKRSRAPVFKADRPFFFLLRQVSTGSVLFMGRVVNPAEQAP